MSVSATFVVSLVPTGVGSAGAALEAEPPQLGNSAHRNHKRMLDQRQLRLVRFIPLLLRHCGGCCSVHLTGPSSRMLMRTPDNPGADEPSTEGPANARPPEALRTSVLGSGLLAQQPTPDPDEAA